MKFLLVVLLIVGSIARVSAQEPFGFIPLATPGPVIKLEGVVVRQIPGGYFAFSVPPKDITAALEVVKHLEPHYALFFAAEELLTKAQKFQPTPGVPAVPLGPCILATKETFSHQHKVLDRNVQAVGTFTCNDEHGRTITLQVYSGGPSKY